MFFPPYFITLKLLIGTPGSLTVPVGGGVGTLAVVDQLAVLDPPAVRELLRL